MRVNASTASFISAILVRADFSNAMLLKADFTGAILYEANFTGANLDGAILVNCGITQEQLEQAESYEGAFIVDEPLPSVSVKDSKRAVKK